jgi:transposase
MIPPFKRLQIEADIVEGVLTQRQIAKAYDVGKTTVSDISRGLKASGVTKVEAPTMAPKRDICWRCGSLTDSPLCCSQRRVA